MSHIEAIPPREISMEILDRVAELENTTPLQLPCLYDVVDPDCLDSLLDSEGVRVAFSYCGYLVTAVSDGEISITEEPHVENRA